MTADGLLRARRLDSHTLDLGLGRAFGLLFF